MKDLGKERSAEQAAVAAATKLNAAVKAEAEAAAAAQQAELVKLEEKLIAAEQARSPRLGLGLGLGSG